MKKKDYIDEFIEYQNHQYSPSTLYPQDGQLPRYLREGDRKPGRMALLFFILNVPVGIFAVVIFAKDFVKSGFEDWGLLGATMFFLAATIIYIMIVVNYIRKAKMARAASAARTADWKKRKGIGRRRQTFAKVRFEGTNKK